MLVLAKWGKCRKRDLPLLSPKQAKVWKSKSCKSSKYQGTSEDTGPLGLETLASLSLHHHSFSARHGVGPGRHTYLTVKLAVKQSSQPKNDRAWAQETKFFVRKCILSNNKHCPHLIFKNQTVYQNSIHSEIVNKMLLQLCLPRHKSVTKWAKMELTATNGGCNPSHKIQHREEI